MIGRVLGGRYEIIEAIDSGGTAYVYKAFCRKTNNTVAIKVLKEKFSNNAEYVKRFKKEAQAVFSLEHENIITVSDIGCEDGTYYLVMEYVAGSTLKAMIEKNGRLTERQTKIIAIQICSALSAAHKRGIIHRDIKPQNILIDKHQKVKVTDFGIAKSLSASEDEEKEVIGSVYYVSPEQARGENVDARTDIYSMGIMLYEMLTGELPYKGDQTVSVALKHINEKITEPMKINPEISRSINNIVLKATSKNKKDRYRSMDAFKEDIVRSLVDPSGDFVDLPYEEQTNVVPNVKKHKLWKTVILFAIVAFLTASVITVFVLLNDSKAQAITLPDLKGQTVSEASKTLEDYGLNVKLEYQQSQAISEGNVISLTPETGSSVAMGGTVTLMISSGPALLIMPNVTGMTLKDAEDEITSMGLDIDSVTYEYHNDLAANTVLSQSPEVDSELSADNAVNLVVSTDVEAADVPMPLLKGMIVDQAVASLYNAGFTNCFVYESESEVAEGEVYDQLPAEGIPVSNNEEIDLWVSSYKQKDYHALLSAQIDVTDADSKINTVLVTQQNDVQINYIVATQQAANSGKVLIDLDVSDISGGMKTIKVFVNSIETYSSEVEFVKRITE